MTSSGNARRYDGHTVEWFDQREDCPNAFAVSRGRCNGSRMDSRVRRRLLGKDSRS
jgi:hypothetical protein